MPSLLIRWRRVGMEIQAALDFDGSFAGAQFGGDLFVERPRDDKLHSFALAGASRWPGGGAVQRCRNSWETVD